MPPVGSGFPLSDPLPHEVAEALEALKKRGRPQEAPPSLDYLEVHLTCHLENILVSRIYI